MYISTFYVSVCGQVADMLLELCVTELEDVATDSQSGRLSSQPVVVESSHPYTDDTSTSGTVKIPGTPSHHLMHRPTGWPSRLPRRLDFEMKSVLSTIQTPPT